jgi:hypothetical protein
MQGALITHPLPPRPSHFLVIGRGEPQVIKAYTDGSCTDAGSGIGVHWAVSRNKKSRRVSVNAVICLLHRCAEIVSRLPKLGARLPFEPHHSWRWSDLNLAQEQERWAIVNVRFGRTLLM